MTYYDCRFLGLESDYTAESGLVIKKTGIAGNYNEYKLSGKNPVSGTAQTAAFPIRVNGKAVDNSKEQYPLLLYKDITYFPLTWRFAVDEFGWAYRFDNTQGLVISSNRSAPSTGQTATVNADGRYSLMVDTAAVSRPASGMTDAELISMFKTVVYKNANYIWEGFFGTGAILNVDKNSIHPAYTKQPEPPPPSSEQELRGSPYFTPAYEVKNMKSIAEAKANLEAVFSLRFLNNSIVYPYYIDGVEGSAKFIEENGKLYYIGYTGPMVESVFAPDFTRAVVKSKNESAFEIEVPMINRFNPDEKGELFAYKVVQQNRYWVLDNFFNY